MEGRLHIESEGGPFAAERSLGAELKSRMTPKQSEPQQRRGTLALTEDQTGAPSGGPIGDTNRGHQAEAPSGGTKQGHQAGAPRGGTKRGHQAGAHLRHGPNWTFAFAVGGKSGLRAAKSSVGYGAIFTCVRML